MQQSFGICGALEVWFLWIKQCLICGKMLDEVQRYSWQ